ncbi:MAG: metal ABC transporter ATP-binding protein [Treponema sp.]|jgi:zinc transport system ATP-binding protein|nr:metal ABC transporter ATP-binding protein [Treponema sp.]
MALISCRDLSFAYEGHTVVWGLNFTVEEGDFLCVFGENGSGKSTLVKGLLGLMPPGGGGLLREGFTAKDVGYLPQETASRKDFPAGVYEVVLSGRLGLRGLRPFYSRTDRRAAEENLERLGIAGLRGCCYRELSGGQQRRVLLARSLCASRKLLVMDEPAAGLDPPAAAELYGLLERLNRELGLTIIMVSHDIEGALNYGGKVLHLRHEQLFFGTPAAYRQSAPGKKFLASPLEAGRLPEAGRTPEAGRGGGEG